MSSPRPLPIPIPLVDTHAHVNLEEFEADLTELLRRSRAGVFPPIRGRVPKTDPVLRPFVAGLICPAVDLATSQRALEIAERFDFVFAAIGVHPNHVALLNSGEWDEICRLVEEETKSKNKPQKLVALGETGLDRHWDDSPFELQRDFLMRTLEQGRRKRLPVIIHSRDANDDLDQLLREFYSGSRPDWRVGVIHSFSGTPAQAERWLELGFYLGFGGFVTYPSKSFSNIREAALVAPLDRILLETDCPFLTPHPLRGKVDRNEPLLCAFAARQLAEIRGVALSEIARATTENATRLFNLPPIPEEPLQAQI